MEAIEALLTRRSIRSFTDQAVEPEKEEALLRAAMHAPSAHNSQDWQFVMVRDEKRREALSTVLPYYGMMKSAPLCILVCAEPAQQKSENLEFYIQDCAAATQNLLLAAHALGLGAVWCGVHPDTSAKAKVRELLNVPETIVPFALVSVGYSNRQPRLSDRYDASKVHQELW